MGVGNGKRRGALFVEASEEAGEETMAFFDLVMDHFELTGWYEIQLFSDEYLCLKFAE